MHLFKIISKIVVFSLCFTVVFFCVHTFHFLAFDKLDANVNSIPWLFSTIGLIFSILSGFIIQTKWHTWDSLLDSIRGELSSLRQINMLAHHFPPETRLTIRKELLTYLDLLVSEPLENLDRGVRSKQIEYVIFHLEDTIFTASIKFPQIGNVIFQLLRKSMEYRDQRIQTSARHMPLMLRTFLIFSTYTVIFSSLFVAVDTIMYDYVLTLLIALLCYGIFLLIDDLDHPYRPGNWHINNTPYSELVTEINEKLADKRKREEHSHI